MGFYSIFSYILDQPENKIIIQSKTNEEAWSIILKYLNDDIVMKYYDHTFDLEHVGTDINIYAWLNRDSIDELLNIYLHFIPDVKIIVHSIDEDYEQYEYTINSNFYRGINDEKIDITINDNNIKVVDYATCISSKILFDSLLIPSSSSKRIKTDVIVST